MFGLFNKVQEQHPFTCAAKGAQDRRREDEIRDRQREIRNVTEEKLFSFLTELHSVGVEVEKIGKVGKLFIGSFGFKLRDNGTSIKFEVCIKSVERWGTIEFGLVRVPKVTFDDLDKYRRLWKAEMEMGNFTWEGLLERIAYLAGYYNPGLADEIDAIMRKYR